MIRVVIESIRERGAWRTLQIIASTLADHAFDLRYGTDICRWAELDMLLIDSVNKRSGVCYVPTRTRAFEHVVAHLPISSDSAFVDCGCGKGKVVMLAAQYPFKRVIGIEFAEELCAIARDNIQQFGSRHALQPVEILHSDVLEYEFTGDEGVFFLFDPFDDSILQPLMQHIDASAALHPRDIWIVYQNPVFRRVIDTSENLRLNADLQHAGSQFLIDQHVSRQQPTAL